MKKFFPLAMTIILALAVALSGCHNSNNNNNTTSGNDTTSDSFNIVFIADATSNTVATNYKSFLEENGHTVSIVALSDVADTTFSAADLIIIGDNLSDWSSYSTQAAAIYNSSKPILALYNGQNLWSTTNFSGITINRLSSASTSSTTTDYINNFVTIVDGTAQYWSKPNAISTTTGIALALYSSNQNAQAVYWPGISSTTACKVGAATWWSATAYAYAPLCYETLNSVCNFLWGFQGDPTAMTETGQKLFLNVVYWLGNS